MTKIHPAIAGHALLKNSELHQRIAELDAQVAALSQQAEPLCEYCDGTGDVHRADGEWLGECRCIKEHRAKVAAGDLLAIAEEVGGLRIAANVAQVTREDLERIVQFVQAEPATAQDERIMAKARELFGWAAGVGGFEDAVNELVAFVIGHARPAQTEQQPVVDATFIGDVADSLISVITEKGIHLSVREATQIIREALVGLSTQRGEA